MTMSGKRIGLVQAQFADGKVEENLRKMKNIIESCKAANDNVQLLLFPELAATGYFLSEELRGCAEGPTGEIAAYMSQAAREYQLYLAYGYAERGAGGKLFNSLRLIDRHGNPIANYQKIHITSLEKETFAAGSQVVSAQTEMGHIGLMICWDLAFPELARLLALRGADLLLAPCAWESPYEDAFLRFATARAIDNTLYVAACNHRGQSGELRFFGKTALFGPDGAMIESAEERQEHVILGDIDLPYRRNVQNRFFTMLQERRKDLYRLQGEEVLPDVSSEANRRFIAPGNE
jgi:predicted amidohydrolase